MDNLPRQKLRELITTYGRSLCDDPRRCEGLLLDFCGPHKREIHALVDALKEGVPADLLRSHAGMPTEPLLARLIARLKDNRAMAEDAANWAVESWALALGVIASPSKGADKQKQKGGRTTAVKPRSKEAPRSPVEGELFELGFQPGYGLPAPAQLMPIVTWLRATIGFAYRTLKKGELDLAINDANKLINDNNLKNLPQYVMVLAAAYYLRGMAYESKGDKAQDGRDYQASIRVLPTYVSALNGLKRVSYSGPTESTAPSNAAPASAILVVIILIIIATVYYANRGRHGRNQPIAQLPTEPVQAKKELPCLRPGEVYTPPQPVLGAHAFDSVPDAPKPCCLLYTSPSPRDLSTSSMPSSA